MQRHRSPLTTLSLVTLLALGSIPAGAAEPVKLFNGKDLAGWEAFLDAPGAKMEDVWSVRDGVLVCKGEPMGYLCTRNEYTSFRLAVEWRWAPGGKPGNSGVLMRINGEPRALPRSIEAQLKSGDAGDVYGFHGMKISGDAARAVSVAGHKLGGDLSGVKREVKGAEKTPGEWNRYDITLRGGELSVEINGRKVNEATGCEILSGKVGLQSEGGEVHFRLVELTPID